MCQQKILFVCRNHVHCKHSEAVSIRGQTESTSAEEVNSFVIQTNYALPKHYFAYFCINAQDKTIHICIFTTASLPSHLFLQHDPKGGSAPDSTVSEMTFTNNSEATNAEVHHNNDQSFISDIISSTPELAHLKSFVEARYRNLFGGTVISHWFV